MSTLQQQLQVTPKPGQDCSQELQKLSEVGSLVLGFILKSQDQNYYFQKFVFSCREVCKQWKANVDNSIIEFKVRNMFAEPQFMKKFAKSFPNIKKIDFATCFKIRKLNDEFVFSISQGDFLNFNVQNFISCFPNLTSIVIDMKGLLKLDENFLKEDEQSQKHFFEFISQNTSIIEITIQSGMLDEDNKHPFYQTYEMFDEIVEYSQKLNSPSLNRSINIYLKGLQITYNSDQVYQKFVELQSNQQHIHILVQNGYTGQDFLQRHSKQTSDIISLLQKDNFDNFSLHLWYPSLYNVKQSLQAVLSKTPITIYADYSDRYGRRILRDNEYLQEVSDYVDINIYGALFYQDNPDGILQFPWLCNKVTKIGLDKDMCVLDFVINYGKQFQKLQSLQYIENNAVFVNDGDFTQEQLTQLERFCKQLTSLRIIFFGYKSQRILGYCSNLADVRLIFGDGYNCYQFIKYLSNDGAQQQWKFLKKLQMINVSVNADSDILSLICQNFKQLEVLELQFVGYITQDIANFQVLQDLQQLTKLKIEYKRCGAPRGFGTPVIHTVK
eukprot:TRINITY_DN5303_c0_g1_i5.p1 TRINITY_DN5303_c0_g1~~TRINITY_DN5303_c0_g1_i5.p1  ORF type:complete len:555 (-),score=31.65 TRINITY_DN5303_c0_g1_i5:24-1688(-)